MPENKPKRKPNLVVDFDGTINSYLSGWKGPDNIPDPPTKGAKEALDQLSKHFRIIIFSVRAETEDGARGIKEYMEKYSLPFNKIQYKKPVGLIIDDNCIRFTGDWFKTIEEIADFTHWHKKEKKVKS